MLEIQAEQGMSEEEVKKAERKERQRILEEDKAAEAATKFDRLDKSYWFSGCRNYVAEKTVLHQALARDEVNHPIKSVRELVMSPNWDFISAGLIMVNCVIIGWQADVRDPDDSTKMMMVVFEQFFTGAFLIELLLRVLTFNWTMFFIPDNWLDMFLVFMSTFSTWLCPLLGLEFAFLRKLTVLRTLRLVRLGRAVRHRPEFKEMWALMKGLTDSTETLFWTYIMISCVLYFFAVMGTSLIGQADFMAEVKFNSTLPKEYIAELQLAQDIADKYFGNVALSMFTLFQVMTLDSWTGIMRPLAHVQPWINWFFIVFISVAAFVLMNLIVAVIVENAFASSNEEQAEVAKELEKKREEDIEDLKKLFYVIDADGSGMISKQELMDASKEYRVRQKLRSLDILPKDIETVWDILDDGDGELSVEEFVEGIRRLQGEARAKDILRLQRELRILQGSVEDIQQSMISSTDGLTRVREQIKRTSDDIEAFRRTMARAKEAVKQASSKQALS